MRETASEAESGRFILWSALGLGVLGLLLYQPWTAAPLPATDFSELIPLLRGDGSPVSRLLDVFKYYLGHGRFVPFTSALYTANWELWNTWAVGWRLARAALMLVVIYEMLRLLHALGMSRAGVFLGASLLVISVPAAESWLRTTTEPLALLFLIWSIRLATGYRHASRWKIHLTGLLSMMFLMLLSKEVMIAAVPVIVLIGLQRSSPDRFRLLQLGPRDGGLIIGALAVTGLLGAGVWWAKSLASPNLYAAAYGSRQGTVVGFIFRLAQTLVPFPLDSPGRRIVGAIFVALTVSGLIQLGRSTERTTDNSLRRPRLGRINVGVMLMLAVLGVLVYAPWPRFRPFYPLPFMLATSYLVAAAVTGAERVDGVRSGMMGFVFALVLLPTAQDAHWRAQEGYAVTRIAYAAASDLPRFAEADQIVVAHPGPNQTWGGPAASLRRYAAVLDPAATDLPRATDEDCSTALRAREPGQRIVVLLSYNLWCGRLANPTSSYRSAFRYLSLTPPGFASDTAVLDLLVVGDLPTRDPRD